MKKFYTITISLLVINLFIPKANAQNWTVGVPVDMSISYLTKYGFDCVQSNQADFNMNIILNSVSGIQYLAIVDSVQNIAVINNTTDTLFQGDTLFLTQGNNNYAVSFLNGGGSISFNFKAVGTPTTAGQNHPCASSDMWMSNLLLCNEGLTLNVQNTCSVDDATSINQLNNSNTSLQFPNMSNQFQLQLNGVKNTNAVNLYDILGNQIPFKCQINNSNISIPCQDLNAGIYFISLLHNNKPETHKFVLNK